MGIFAGFVSKVKQVGRKAVNTVKKGVKSVREKVTNVWNKWTGKETFDKADKLYDSITRKYNEHRKQFESEVDRLVTQIEAHVEAINNSKSKVKTELFVEMATNMSKIKDIAVSKDFVVEEYKAAFLKVDAVRTKDQLYGINFNKLTFKERLLKFLGFYTRKKAKETLYAVQEEGKKLEAEMAKMDSELIKLQAIAGALQNVEHYFTTLITIYEQLLVRLDNSVHFLYFRCMHFAHRLVGKEMSIRRLPVMQQKEIEALITASKLLKGMTDAQLVSVSDEASVTEYAQAMGKQHEKIQKIYRAA